MQDLFLSGIYCHKTGTRPPSCNKPREPTMYVRACLMIGHLKYKSNFILFLQVCHLLTFSTWPWASQYMDSLQCHLGKQTKNLLFQSPLGSVTLPFFLCRNKTFFFNKIFSWKQAWSRPGVNPIKLFLHKLTSKLM